MAGVAAARALQEVLLAVDITVPQDDMSIILQNADDLASIRP
jgi:hypothetical protein